MMVDHRKITNNSNVVSFEAPASLADLYADCGCEAIAA